MVELFSDILVVTFGCRLNIYESEKIKEILKSLEMFNFIVVNTCAVTKEAERQAKQKIRQLRKKMPEKKIIITGCAATVNAIEYSLMDGVFQIISNKNKFNVDFYKHIKLISSNDESLKNKNYSFKDYDEKNQLPVIVRKNEVPQENKSKIINQNNNFENFQMISGYENKKRAFLQIQTGCDNFCTFCVVRLARGKSVSFPATKILEQINLFIKNGYKEINLTGVDILSYEDLSNSINSFGELLKFIFSQMRIDVALRLSSLDTKKVDDELINLLKNQKNLRPHIHLSLQSGDSSVLKRMRRRHNKEDIYDLVAKLRKARSDVTIGADIIVGFPGETEEEYANTFKMVSDLSFEFLHVFKYSDREMTAAAEMFPKIPRQKKEERSLKLRELSKINLLNGMKKKLGEEVEILIESFKENFEINDPSFINNNFMIGKSEHFYNVLINDFDKNLVGALLRKKIIKIIEKNGVAYLVAE